MTLFVFSFYRLNTRDPWQRENIGYRAGFISICQLPLIFLLAGKNNIIGFLAGSSYERLNWLHRWTARCLFVTTTIHMGFFMKSWARYDYILEEDEGGRHHAKRHCGMGHPGLDCFQLDDSDPGLVLRVLRLAAPGLIRCLHRRGIHPHARGGSCVDLDPGRAVLLRPARSTRLRALH